MAKKIRSKKVNKHRGSSFDDFLEEQGIKEEMSKQEFPYDTRILENWNESLSNEFYRELTRMKEREFDYHSNRLLSQSLHVFQTVDDSFRVADLMLNCFSKQTTRTQREIISQLEDYHFNQHIVDLLRGIEGLKFDHSANDNWLQNTTYLLGTKVALHWAAKALIESMNAREYLGYLRAILSDPKFYKLYQRR